MAGDQARASRGIYMLVEPSLPEDGAPIPFAEFRRELAERASRSEPLSGRPCYIYGAGGFGRRLASELLRHGAQVKAFIDRRARSIGGSVSGILCLHPDEVTPEDARSAAYVHGMMNYRDPSSEVVNWASALGFAELLFPTNLYSNPPFKIESYWLSPPRFLVPHLGK